MSLSNTPDLTGRSQGGRKLIAVIYADMVGYSRLIALDDIGTLQRLRALRKDVIDPVISEHGGSIVQTGGDSLLIVFDSIDGAVRCAMTMQQQIPIHDREQATERAIRFRIGINIGDVIADGTDFHGDVVNVAARLQAECPPGGICVSRAVRDHVHGRLDLRFEELGNLDLKNIARPVEAFVLRSDAATDRRPPVSEPPGLRSDLDLQRLHLFHRVAKLGSVARAAEELRVGQATVSAQVGELEQQWGVELLHRLPHSVALTDAGQLAFEHAERIFSQAGELRSMLQSLLGAPTGRLAVGGSLTAGEFFLPTVATRFKAHHPDVELSVALYNSSVVLDKVVRSELDLGFVGTDAIVGDLTAIPCWEDEIVIIRSTASTTGVAPDGDVLHSRQFVMREPGSGTRQHIEQSLLRRGLSVKTAMVVGSPEAVKRYVAAGVGWGFASKESIATEVATGQLAIVPSAGWDCRRVFYAVHRKGYRLSPPQQQFIEHAQILMGRS